MALRGIPIRMTNMNFNYTGRYTLYRALLIAVVVGVYLCMPSKSFAETITTRTDTPLRGVCLRVVSLESGYKQKLSDAGYVYARVATERLAKLRAQAIRRGSEDVSTRKISDERVSGYVDALRQKAKGDATRGSAIEAFNRAIQTAILERRAAADAAQKTYMTGLQSLADTRTQEVAMDAVNFQKEILASLTRAKSACDSGADPEGVRDELHAALSALDKKYKAIFTDQRVITEGLQALSTARTERLLAAAAAFSASVDKASQTLQTVLQ